MRAWWRVVLGMATGGVIAFAGVGLNVAYASGPQPAPVATPIAPTAPAAPVAPATSTTTPPAPTTAKRAAAPSSVKSARSTTTRTTAPRARSTAGCGQRAVNAGRYDSSCPEYQGYLDPGTRAGRGPTSGEVQLQYACEQGLVPKEQC